MEVKKAFINRAMTFPIIKNVCSVCRLYILTRMNRYIKSENHKKLKVGPIWHRAYRSLYAVLPCKYIDCWLFTALFALAVAVPIVLPATKQSKRAFM